MDQPNVWNDFQERLTFTFVRVASGLPVDWRSQILSLRQIVMKGMAFNTPDPPGPTQLGYPPVTVLRQLTLWRRQSINREQPATSPFLVDDGFREYFFSLMNMTAFMLNQLRSTEGAEEEMSEEEVEEEEEGTEENQENSHPPLPTRAAPKPPLAGDDSESSGEVAEVEEIETLPDASPIPTNPNKTSNAYEPSNFQPLPDGDAWTDAIAELTAQFFVEFVDDLAFLLNHFSAATKVSLYEKYKNNAMGVEDPTEIILDALENICPPLSEAIGPSKLTRRHIQNHPRFSATEQFFNHPQPRVRMVYSLAHAIDSDFLILHYEEKKGYIVNISGCSDNKMLGIILAATLISNKDPHMLPGTPPSPTIQELFTGEEQTLDSNEQWAHPWSFSNWTCVKPDGTVPAKMAGASHWLWPEGSPAQIQKWNDYRVIILAKVPFPRKFDPIRVFSSLKIHAEVKQVLSEEKYREFISQIAATPEDVRKQAHERHLKWKC